MTIRNDNLQLTANDERSAMSILQFKSRATLNKSTQIEFFVKVMDIYIEYIQKQEKNSQPLIQRFTEEEEKVMEELDNKIL